jgi:hypothetical protein
MVWEESVQTRPTHVVRYQLSWEEHEINISSWSLRGLAHQTVLYLRVISFILSYGNVSLESVRVFQMCCQTLTGQTISQ